MPVDPFLLPIIENYPLKPDPIDDYPAYRAAEKAGTDALVAQVAEPGPDVRERRRVTIEVAGGTIDLLIYQPFTPGPHPAHLFLHGGAWLLGSIDHLHVDITCRERCIGADCVVVSVDYRKAPEHKFPVPLDDCYAALTWVAAHAAELDIQADLITVGGQSAGGNLAAAVALKARDEDGPALALQLLEVPALNLTFVLDSHTRYGAGYALALSDMQSARAAYLVDPAAEATNPYVSPVFAADLSGLPPAYIMTAEYDALRDDGQQYADLLAAAGVPATLSLQLGHVHISAAATAGMESSRAWRAELLDELRRAHRTPAATAAPEAQ